jgi:allophanate hydrolase subunit 1
MPVHLGDGEPLGEGALRFRLPGGVDPPALLATLRAQPGVIDAVVTDAWAAVTFADEPPPLRDLELVALPAPRTHIVSVRYDGPDLGDVATHAGLAPDEVVRLHAAGTYRVLFVGFAPGFAYLGGLDRRLACPRRTSPRQRVPAGSVAIGDAYTAVYPSVSPGGWNLIGTALETPRGLAAGDLVRFVPA